MLVYLCLVSQEYGKYAMNVAAKREGCSNMADENPETGDLLQELAGGISSILKRQEELSEKLDALEARLRRLEEEALSAGFAPSAQGEKTTSSTTACFSTHAPTR